MPTTAHPRAGRRAGPSRRGAQQSPVPSGAQWCPVGKRARDEAVELRSSQSPVGMGPRGNVPGLVRNTT